MQSTNSPAGMRCLRTSLYLWAGVPARGLGFFFGAGGAVTAALAGVAVPQPRRKMASLGPWSQNGSGSPHDVDA